MPPAKAGFIILLSSYPQLALWARRMAPALLAQTPMNFADSALEDLLVQHSVTALPPLWRNTSRKRF
jgi:hypothetical protein